MLDFLLRAKDANQETSRNNHLSNRHSVTDQIHPLGIPIDVPSNCIPRAPVLLVLLNICCIEETLRLRRTRRSCSQDKRCRLSGPRKASFSRACVPPFTLFKTKSYLMAAEEVVDLHIV